MFGFKPMGGGSVLPDKKFYFTNLGEKNYFTLILADLRV
jgi:hypothetical protein